MRAFLLLLIVVAVACAALAPGCELGESAARALEASAISMGLERGDPEEREEDVPAPPRREGRAASTPTTTRKRVTPFISKKVAARQRFRCAMCGGLLAEDWEVDHVVSLQRGGGNDLGNLQALHKRCHAYKNHLERHGVD